MATFSVTCLSYKFPKDAFSGLNSLKIKCLRYNSRKKHQLINMRECHEHFREDKECYCTTKKVETACQIIPDDQLPTLSKRHPNIDKLGKERLQCTLQILQKFAITAAEACDNLHVFSMNPITMDNYGEILKECGFISIHAQHIIKYHTIARSKTIVSLKKAGLIRDDLILEKLLLDCFKDWPSENKALLDFSDSTTSIVTIRTSVLHRYLKWRLSISTEEFEKYCRNYLPLRHKPMSDIREALDIAENEIKFDKSGIRRNGFLIASDPVNTKLILENVPSLAGLDIREAIRVEPAILKNNYNALLQIRDILEFYRIPLEAQRKSLKVYCMRPDTVKERLDELKELKEFKILSSNPRALTMVIHKKKMINRLNKIQAAKKQCYSLNHLISSNKVFNSYITSFGSKVCGRDIAVLINSSLNVNQTADLSKKDILNTIINQLRRHKYWLHVALDAIDENIQLLKRNFDDQVIYNNCLLVLYPITEVQHYTDILLKMRRDEGYKESLNAHIDVNYTHLKHKVLTDEQILSLVLYEIEKKYHFSGDGIWARLDVVKTDAKCN